LEKKKMKKMYKILALAMVLVFLFTACAPKEEPVVEEPVVEQPVVEEPVVEEPEVMEKLRIAVVSPSSINDFAFTQSIYDAMVALQEAYGEDVIEFVYSENMFVVDDAAAAIRDYAASGFDMVIAHGSQYGSSLQEIAPDFPDISFAWGTTVDTFGIPNVFAYEAASDEGGFVNGVMAAMMTESKVIGVVGPIETGDAKLYVDGFVAGVKATDPTIDVRVTYIGSFSDVALAAEAAETHIAAGADILTGTAQMVVGAIGKIQEAGGYWFGTQSDQASFASDTVVASQVYHWEVILKEIIDLRAQGILGGQSFIADLANAGQVMSFNSEIDIPADVMAAAEATIANIIGGQEIEPFEMEQLSIAIVSPSAINDFAFTQSIYDAMVALQELYGEDVIQFVYSESMFVVDDAAAAIRDYAASGYDMVIAHGSQYGSSLQEIAPDFPEISFAWGTTVDTFGIPNIFAYEAASHEGGFVNGVMAAMMTETKVIGVVGPIETGDAKLYVDGFVAGVKATDPTIDVRVTYIGSFSDVALAAEAAETHIAAGADILTGTAQMVVGAIGKIQEAGGYWFGTQADQASFAPDTVVASQVYHWEVILKEIIGLRAQGILGGQSFIADLANGGQVMSFNENIDIPADVMAAAEAAIQGIIDGTIVIELP
jgi:basic membrane lipoprotein Med (substrate-binding protein (PBP1-ABC) superfamily)